MSVSGGSPVLASDINEALNRRIGRAQAVSDWGSAISTTETCTESVTVNVKAGRTYEVSAFFPLTGSTAGDEFFVLLRQGSSASDLQLTYDRPRVHSTGAVYVAQPRVEWTASADGAVTFGVLTRRASGSGTITPKGATSQPRFIKVVLQTTE